MTVNTKTEKCVLSSRQMEIMWWLHQGKTATEIAGILGVADVTIRKHIINIKMKTQCNTMFQLGEYYSKIIEQVGRTIKIDN